MQMDLAPFIKNLLYRHDCVILPGFGGFIANYHSAHFHPVTHTFYPPFKKLGFNSQLTLNDGLLATEISFHFKISQEVAQQKVSKYIRSLNDTIHSGEVFELADIGQFRLNEEGNILFTPVEKVNFLAESYGMGSFRSPAVLRQGEPITFADTKEKIKELPRAVPSRQWLRVAAVAVPLFALSALGYFIKDPLTNSYRQYSYLNLVPESVEAIYTERTLVEPAAETEENEILFSQYYQEPMAEPIVEIENADAVVEDTKEVEVYAAPSGMRYHIIAGCFSVSKNAHNLVDDLRTKGFQANIVGTNPKGWELVAFESYMDREKAENALRTIQSEHNPQAWLLTK